MCLNLQLGVNFNVRVLPNWHIRYGRLSTSVEYLPTSTLSLAEYSYWQCCFLPIPLVVTSFPIFLYNYGHSLVEAGTRIMKSTVMVREPLICHFLLILQQCCFTIITWRKKWYIHSITLLNVKCWRFCPIIANRQSLLLANIHPIQYSNFCNITQHG